MNDAINIQGINWGITEDLSDASSWVGNCVTVTKTAEFQQPPLPQKSFELDKLIKQQRKHYKPKFTL